MTIEEAIGYLSDGYCDVKPTDDENMTKLKHNHNDAYEIALEALEKQIPKKIITKKRKPGRSGFPTFDFFCPVCEKDVSPINDKYCKNCGQKLYWGNEE